MSAIYSLSYLAAVMFGLLVYARYYNLKKQMRLRNAAQFYEHSFGKDIYDTLASNPTRNTKLELAALLGWASEDISRTFRMNEAKAALQVLNQNGYIGDELVKRFTGSEVLLRQEVQGIAAQAQEKLDQNGPQQLLGAAQEIAQNVAVRRRLAQIDVFKNEYLAMAANKNPIN